MAKLKKGLNRIKAELDAKHGKAKASAHSFVRFTMVGTSHFIIGMIVENIWA